MAYIPRDGFVPGRGWRVSLVVEGEHEHRPTGTWPYTGAIGEQLPWFWGNDYAAAVERASYYNMLMGISEADALAIVTASMAGPGRAGRGKGKV